MNDPQKQKVYMAEWTHSAYQHLNFRSVEAVERWANQLIGSNWFGCNWPHMAYHPVRILDLGDEESCTSVAVSNTIDMAKWSWKKIIVCHELAHLCNVDSEIFQSLCKDELGRRRKKRGVASHGKKFCSIYLKIVERALGKEAAKELQQNFKEQGVIYEKSVGKRKPIVFRQTKEVA